MLLYLYTCVSNHRERLWGFLNSGSVAFESLRLGARVWTHSGGAIVGDIWTAYRLLSIRTTRCYLHDGHRIFSKYLDPLYFAILLWAYVLTRISHWSRYNLGCEHCSLSCCTNKYIYLESFPGTSFRVCALSYHPRPSRLTLLGL